MLQKSINFSTSGLFMYILVAFFSLVLSTQVIQAQNPTSQCVHDPLFNFTLESDPCCGVPPESITCYEDITLTQAVLRLSNIIIDGNVFQASTCLSQSEIGFSNLQELADLMNLIVGCLELDALFSVNPTTGSLCVTGEDADIFGDIEICTDFSFVDGCETLEATETPGCDPEQVINEPTITWDDLANPNPDEISDTPLITTPDGTTISPQDALTSGNSEDPNGPNSGAVAVLLDAVAESGALQNGYGCPNLSCIDLPSLTNSFNPTDPGYPDMFAEIEDQVANYNADNNPNVNISNLTEHIYENVTPILSDIENGPGGFTGYLNEQLGLNIPLPPPCPGDEGISFPIETPLNANNQNKSNNALLPWEDGATTESDGHFFDSVIPGIGAEGASGANPSPSGLDMIKNINAGVDLYNGSQSTSVPLYTFQANDIAIPISVNSGNNGLMVNSIGGSAGQNWNINAGGMISRVVKGLPDEFKGTLLGKGVGRHKTLKHRFEFPANVGLNVVLGDKCENPLSGPEGWILNGVNQDIPDSTPPSPTHMTISWSPLTPNLVNATINIQIISQGIVTVFLQIGFNVGVSLNDELGPMNYEEEGIGYLNLNNAPFGIESFPSGNGAISGKTNLQNLTDEQDVLNVLEKVHSNKGIEDGKFLNSQITTWDSWIDAIKLLLNISPTYKTKRLDTEPDEFHFNFGGYSGKFSIRPDGTPIIFPAQNLQIRYNDDWESTGNITEFIITTTGGMEYTFGSSGPDLEGVDFSQDISYTLPNYYTYRETDFDSPHAASRRSFDKAQVDIAQMIQVPFFGPKEIITYGNTYDRNYKAMSGPRFSSGWHLMKIRSLMTTEEVDLEYEKRGAVYYSDKSYSHTFPNFSINSPEKLRTIENGSLNPLHTAATQWKNGRAEFVYSANQTFLKRWDLITINGRRGESVHFTNDQDRAEIVDDKLCSKIAVKRNGGALFKGWKFDYEILGSSDLAADCNEEATGSDPTPPLISINEETTFDLGELYELKNREYHEYFNIGIAVFCFNLNIPLQFKYLAIDKHWGHRTKMTEFGSLMELKDFLGDYDEELETRIYNAEHKRTFLKRILELDTTYNCEAGGSGEDEGVHAFLEFRYKNEDEIASLPKRFSINQDQFGYHIDNSLSGSPLPPIKYTAIETGDIITANTSGVINQFPFSNSSVPESQIHLGRRETLVSGAEGDIATIETGALAYVDLVTGASIGYDYELNELPTGNFGAGLRVAQLVENPGDSPAKTTSYTYENPTVVNSPIYVFQTPFDLYARGGLTNSSLVALEQKVVTTSSPQNVVYPNKGNHVGYQKVTENWSVGSKEHIFSLPSEAGSFSSLSGSFSTSSEEKIDNLHYHEDKTKWLGSPEFGLSNSDVNENLVPPSLRFPTDLSDKNWLLGIEKSNKTFDASGSLRQENTYNYQAVPGGRPIIPYFKSKLYQFNWTGTFANKFTFGLIKNLRPQGETLVDDWVAFIANLFAGTAFHHPYKKILREYLVSDRAIGTGNIRPISTETTNYFPDGTQNSSSVAYSYDVTSYTPPMTSPEPGGASVMFTPTTITTTSGDDATTSVENIFAYQDAGVNFNHDFATTFEPEAIAHLQSFFYEKPVFSRKLLDGNVVSQDFTALGFQDGRIVPTSTWTLLDLENGGTRQITGRFTQGQYSSPSDYNADGKPINYWKATRNTQHSSALDLYYPATELSWTPQLQLASRTYQGFSTSNYYDNDYYTLDATVNVDGIGTSFTYDPRWRLTKQLSMVLGVTDTSTEGDGGLQENTYIYNIGAGNNSIESTTKFTDGIHEPQSTLQVLDGFGRMLTTKRLNDNVTLQSASYDDFFRQETVSQIGKGTTTFEYDESPLPAFTIVTDGAGNISETIASGEVSGYYSRTTSIDPNEITSYTFADGHGRTVKTISGEGSETYYNFDPYSRIATIINPMDEQFRYGYNKLGLLESREIPGAAGESFFYDEKYRLCLNITKQGEVFAHSYDNLDRPLNVSIVQDGGIPSTNQFGFILESDIIDIGEPVLENGYALGNTWLLESSEAIFTNSGINGVKTTTISPDSYGRTVGVASDYPAGGSVNVSTILADSNLPTDVTTGVSLGDAAFSAHYRYGYDDVLRQVDTRLDAPGVPGKIISRLVYDNQDRVKAKFLGQISGDEFLQEVNYSYDGISRLLTINSPVTWECSNLRELCALETKFEIVDNIGLNLQNKLEVCNELKSISVNGQEYVLEEIIDLLEEGNEEEIEMAVATAFDFYGYLYEEILIETETIENGIHYKIRVLNTNATELVFILNSCKIEFRLGECCEITDITDTGGGSTTSSSPNADLYYQANTYDGLDIVNIQLGNGCKAGKMVNDYTYDDNHRVTEMHNKVYLPELHDNAYSTTYDYDLAGNIVNLTRRGMVGMADGVPQFDMIDKMTYNYVSEENYLKLESIVEDTDVLNPEFQPLGFAPISATFGYDGAGNITDNGDGGTAKYNSIGLPKLMEGQEGSVEIEYTYGAEKIRELSTPVEGELEDRRYIGGVEFVNDKLEVYHFGDGRIDLSEEGREYPQYTITDHLGNVVVLFGDKDENGTIEEDVENPEESEVLQRNTYYPFGLAMTGCWNPNTDPKQDYLYNGKELETSSGLNWHFYGARMYDAAIGRFTGVDPIADQFAFVSVYNYAENEPIGHIDLWGLQSAIPKQEAEQRETAARSMLEGNSMATSDSGTSVVHQEQIDHAFESLDYFDDRPISYYALLRYLEGKGGYDIYNIDVLKNHYLFGKGYEKSMTDIKAKGKAFLDGASGNSFTGYSPKGQGGMGLFSDFGTGIGSSGFKYFVTFNKTSDSSVEGTAYITFADTYRWDRTRTAGTAFIAGDHNKMADLQGIGAANFSVRAYTQVNFTITQGMFGTSISYPPTSALSNSGKTSNHTEISQSAGYRLVGERIIKDHRPWSIGP